MSDIGGASAERGRHDVLDHGGTFFASAADETAGPAQASDLLWPTLSGPQDLPGVEAVPLSARGLPASTYAMLERAASLWPERSAVTVLPSAERFRKGHSCSYATLLADVRRTANAFTAAGVTRRGTVGLLSPNNVELLAATLAAQAAGIAVPVNPGLASEHLVGILKRAAVKVLVAAGPEVNLGLWGTARQVASQLGVSTLLALRLTGATDHAPVLEPLDGIDVAFLSERAQAQPDDRLLAPAPAAADLAAFFHTGGTTGTPKLAAHTHANEVSDAWMIAAGSALAEDAVVFAALPLFQVNALVVTVLGPLMRGRHVIWGGPLGYRDPDLYRVFWRIVEHHVVATLSGVPTVYAALAQVPVDADVSSLRFATVGASPLPGAVREAFQDRSGVELVEGYGLTEATCASARQFPGQLRPGSVGQRLPYQRVKAVGLGPSGSRTDLASGEPGLLAVSGPNVFAGYVTGHDADGPVLDHLGTVHDGWLDTGDLARVDSDGYVYLTGRAKDVIIRGGHNIDPATIEDTLLAHPDVTSASAVGRPDAHAGEAPVVYVTTRTGAGTTALELEQWAAKQIREPAATPKEVVILDALPVTDVGKLYKPALRQDAVRREAEAALRRAGFAEPLVASTFVDGAITVTVTGTGDRSRLARAFALYTFNWRLRP